MQFLSAVIYYYVATGSSYKPKLITSRKKSDASTEMLFTDLEGAC